LLAERDKNMSEQKKSFMQELDSWSSEAVVAPLLDRGAEAIAEVQKALREKVLQSYRNGQKAAPRPMKEWKR
jgi:hypothetical protein